MLIEMRFVWHAQIRSFYQFILWLCVAWPAASDSGCCDGFVCNSDAVPSDCRLRFLERTRRKTTRDICTARVVMTLFWRNDGVRHLILLSSFTTFCMCVGLLVIVLVLRDE